MRVPETVRSITGRHRATLIALGVFTGMLLTGQLSNMYSLLGSTTTLLFSGSTTAVFLEPEKDQHAVGEISAVDIRVTAPSPINAVGATISFDPAALEIVGISKATSFLDLWTEETNIMEDEGKIRFSGGTVRRGGLIGTGTILTLILRPKKDGATEITIPEARVYAHDGKGNLLESENKSLILTVTPGHASNESGKTLPPPNPDFNSDGSVTLADISILAIQLVATYNTRYDLDRDGSVNIKDLSILVTRMQKK